MGAVPSRSSPMLDEMCVKNVQIFGFDRTHLLQTIIVNVDEATFTADHVGEITEEYCKDNLF